MKRFRPNLPLVPTERANTHSLLICQIPKYGGTAKLSSEEPEDVPDEEEPPPAAVRKGGGPARVDPGLHEVRRCSWRRIRRTERS